jgi:hypothetical protein
MQVGPATIAAEPCAADMLRTVQGRCNRTAWHVRQVFAAQAGMVSVQSTLTGPLRSECTASVRVCAPRQLCCRICLMQWHMLLKPAATFNIPL